LKGNHSIAEPEFYYGGDLLSYPSGFP